MTKLSNLLALTALSLASANAQAEAPLFYGFMTSNEQWLDDGSEAWSHYGFYTYRTDGSQDFQAVSAISEDNDWALNAGVYADGKYYCYSVPTGASWMRYTLSFRTLETETWTVTGQTDYKFVYSQRDTEESQKAYLVPSDMAYDPIGKVIYAAARAYNSDQDQYLCTVDPESGLLTRIGQIPTVATLTAATDGTLYAVGFDGNLYKIEKDATYTEVGPTGYFPSNSRHQSATTDYADGQMYWSMCGFNSLNDRNYNINGVRGVVSLDPATGKGTLQCSYPHDEVLTAVSIMVSDLQAPADVQDLTFLPEEFASANGVITFTLPTNTTAMQPLTSELTVNVLLDGESVHTAKAQPGSRFTYTISSISDGEHVGAVEVSNGENRGNRTSATAYFGFDVPAKVTDIKFTANDDHTVATLSWTAPTTSKNGMPYPADKLRYRVERYPGAEILKRSLKETELTDEITREYALTYYVITPYNIDKPAELGASARSGKLMMGQPMSLPWATNFDTADDFSAFTTIDANEDGGDGAWGSPIWCFDEQYACAFYYGKRDVVADDWLITPPIAFDPDRLYRLTYKWYGYYGYGNKFELAVGPEAEVASLGRVIQTVEDISYSTDNPGKEQEVIFAVREGDQFLAFHNVTETMDHLSIDDLYIEDCGDARVPAAVEVTAKRLGERRLQLTIVAPKLTAGGVEMYEPLTVEIYREGATEACKKFEAVNPGENLTWIDEDATNDVNAFTLYATNKIGRGLKATVSINLSPSVPKSVTAGYVQYINDRQVEITWDPVDDPEGENGNPVNLDDVRYLVYRIVPGDEEVSYELIARDLEECRWVDDDPLYGYNADSQQYIQYYVASVNDAGEAIATLTPGAIVGDAYTLPFTATWLYGNPEESTPWLKSSAGASWYNVFKGYDPMVDAQDGYGMLSCETGWGFTEGMAIIQTPRLDLSSMAEPKLTFYVYHDPSYPADSVYVMPAIDIEGGQARYIGGAIQSHASETGWKQYEFDLSKYGAEKRASIMLVGFTVDGWRLHLDNFRVEGTAAAGEVRTAYIIGDARPMVGRESKYIVTALNTSATDAANVAVSLKQGDLTLGRAFIDKIAAGSKGSAEIAFTPTTAGTLTLTAGDVSKELDVQPASTALITDLNGSLSDGKVTLTWGAPTKTTAAVTANDDFETYEAFSIANLGSWTLYDGDQLVPFQFQDSNGKLEWPNYNQRQAWIVFNPVTFTSGLPIAANSGSQLLASFASPYGANDDWLISPELSGERQLISFYARAMNADETESLHLLVSDSDAEPENFQAITDQSGLTLSGDWELYHFALPEGTRHFAIRYAGSKQSGVLIDDVRMCAFHNAAVPTAYNVYCDGSFVDVVTDCEFTDLYDGGKHSFTVRPLYGTLEGDDSNVLVIDPAGITEINADSETPIYDLQGRRVAHPKTPGLYLQQGSKVIVK